MRARHVLLMAVLLLGVLLVLLLPRAPMQAKDGEKVELGQTVEGAGSANFAWLRFPGMQFAVAFRAPKTGTLTEITLQWKTKGGYGSGTLGSYLFELRENGEENFPAAKVIAATPDILPQQAMNGYPDGAFRFPIAAELQEGEIYHLVIGNTDPDPKQNWSSPNTLMTRVGPWEGGDFRAAFNPDGAWRPWSSQKNPFNAKKVNEVNGARCPLMLRWQDGTITGDPYYSAAIQRGAYFYGTQRAGQLIVWDRPTATISRIGISVWKRGAPGDLLYHVEEVSGGALATGVIATAADGGDIAAWIYKELPAPIELRQGKTYRLWFNSPASPDADNCFFQCVPYGEKRPAEWLQGGWGGTASHYIYGDGATWTGQEHADLTFSLR